MTGIHQVPAPTRIARATTNAIIVYLGGDTNDVQIDATKILLAQGGSLLSTWRYAADLTKMDAAKIAGNILAAQMQTNVLAAIIAAGGIVNADVAAAAAIAKSKISTTGAWAESEIPDLYVKKSGSTMTGNLTIAYSSGYPSLILDALSGGNYYCNLTFKSAGTVVGQYYYDANWLLFLSAASKGFGVDVSSYGSGIVSYHCSSLQPSASKSGVANLGNATYYWNDVSYKTLTDRGCITYLDPDLAIEYLKAIKPHATKIADAPRLKEKKIKMQMLDYESFPDFIKDIPEKIPVRGEGKRNKEGKVAEWIEMMPQDGVEIGGILSMLIAANKGMIERIEALEQKVIER